MKNYENYVNTLKRKLSKNKNNLIFVCIGTNKIITDSIGPLVGTYLEKEIDKNKIIGNMKQTFCSKYDLYYNYSKLKDKFIIAIDVALAKKELMGEIFISESPIIMGMALNKNKGIIGDMSIKIAISNLEHLDWNYVQNLAQFVAKGILEAIK